MPDRPPTEMAPADAASNHNSNVRVNGDSEPVVWREPSSNVADRASSSSAAPAAATSSSSTLPRASPPWPLSEVVVTATRTYLPHSASVTAAVDGEWKPKPVRTRGTLTSTWTTAFRGKEPKETPSDETTTTTTWTSSTFLSSTTVDFSTTTDLSGSPSPSQSLIPAPPFPYPGRPGNGGDDYFYLQDSSVKGLYWQSVLAAIFWIFMIIIFVLGRLMGKSGRRIFATRCEVMRKETPEFELNPIKCWQNVYHVTDKEIIQNVGLDGMMFLKFLRVSFYMLLMISVVIVPVITPINYWATIPDDPNNNQPPVHPTSTATQTGLLPTSFLGAAHKLFTRNESDSPGWGNFTDPISRFASTGLVRFTIANVQPGSKLLIAHTVFTYLVTAIFFGWLYTTYRDYVAIENEYMREDSTMRSKRERKNELVQFRTVMVRDIPKPLRDDAKLEEYFSKLGIGEVQYAVMDRKVDPDLEDMIKEREFVLNGLENAYVEWHTRVERKRSGRKTLWETLVEAAEEGWANVNGKPRAAGAAASRNGATAVPGSPSSVTGLANGGQQHQDGSDSEGSGSDDGENAPLTGRSKQDGNSPESLRPKHFVGRRFWFFGGREVDSIDYYTTRFAFLNAEIDRKRKLALNDESVQYNSSGFVTFKTQRSATIASQVLLRSSINPFTITTNLAPHPHDVIWSALNLSLHQKVIQSFCVTVIILVITFFWGIPIGFISTFTSLSSLSKVPFLKPLLDQILKIEWLNIILQTLLPPLLFRVFLAIVPNIIQYIINWEGIEARSWKELAVFDRFYTFLLFNVLFVFVLSNAVYNFIGGLFDNPISIIKLLGTVLPKGASFFTNYAVYTSSYFAWELGRPMVILLYMWRKRTCKTPREFFQLNRETAYIDYGVYYPYHLNMLVICIVYSVQAPIILIAGLFYFGFGYLVYKHQLVYVYVKEWENHGRHWPLVFNRTVFGLVIFQLVMIGLLAVKQSPLNATAIVPLLLVTLLFYTYCNRAFAKRTEFVPLDQLRREGAPSASPPRSGTEAGMTRATTEAEDPDAVEDYEEATAAAHEQPSPIDAQPTPIETVVIFPGQQGADGQDAQGRRVMFRGSNVRGRIRAFTGDQADVGMSRHRLYINPAFSSDLPQPWLPVAVVSALPASDPLSLFAPLYDDAAPAHESHRHVGGVPLGPGNKLEKMLAGSVRELDDVNGEHSREDVPGAFADDEEGSTSEESDEERLLGPPSLGQVFVSRMSSDGPRSPVEGPSRRSSMPSPLLSSSVNQLNPWSATPPESGPSV